MNKNLLTFLTILCLLSTVFPVGLAFNIQPVKASGTIYIRADGSVDPSTANITSVDNVTYIFTGNINNSIIVERDNIVVDGAGYTVQGSGIYESMGIFISGRSNVTIKETSIKDFYYCIYLNSSSRNSVHGNNIGGGERNRYGVYLRTSSNNTISENVIRGSDVVATGDYCIYVWGSFNIIVGNKMTDNWGGVILVSSNNNISENEITTHRGMGGGMGIMLDYAKYNSISGNTINGGNGICISASSNNSISGNAIKYNNRNGLWFRYRKSVNNTISENNITSNGNGIYLESASSLEASNNLFHHNNFADNSVQIQVRGFPVNDWDDGVGEGNYWSDYEDRYPDAEEIDGLGIWNTPYFIDEDNQDNYPLMYPCMHAWMHEHELVASIAAPTFLQLDSSLSLNATVSNEGLNDEVDVELVLLINGTTVDSTTIPLLQEGNSHTLSYLWTPTAEGTYNVTTYAHPVTGETSMENNQMSKNVTVSASALPPEVGVKAGDWIKCDYTVTGWPAGTPYPEWLKVEILGVEGTIATVRVAMHMSDGTEQSDTMSVDVVAGGGTFGTISGFVIPSDNSIGDSIEMGGDGSTFTVTIDGETTRTYGGASRTVVSASFSQYGTQLTYYWDKQTGIIVESSATSGGMTATVKVAETNMWVATPLWMQWWLWAIVVAVIVVSAGAVYLKKRKPTTAPPLLSENAEQTE